jgi:hypothetical protein
MTTLDKYMKIFLACLGVFVFGVFISTAAPTLFLGDSGEIISAAYTLGIGHPPGYPLYMLMSKIFTFLPVGDTAFRVNLLAVSLAVLFFISFYYAAAYILMALFGQKKSLPLELTAVLFACIYEFSYIFWFQTGNAKGGIYIMAQLFELMAIFSCVKFVFEKQQRHFYLTAYLAGFLPSIHHSTVLAAFFIIAALGLSMMKLEKRQMVNGACFFLLALFTPYIYLFIRAKASPAVHWGDISTFGQVMNHIIRKVYFTLPRGPFTAEVAFFKLRNYMGQFIYCYRVGIIFEAAGLVFLFIKHRNIFYWLSAFLILNLSALIYFTGHSFAPFNAYMNSNFYLILDVAAILAAAAGFYWLLEKLTVKIKKVRALVVVLCFLLPVTAFISNYGVNNQSRKFLAYDNANNDMRTLKDGDVLFAEEDFQVFNLLYFQYVKHMYPGIRVYDRSANFFDTSVFKEFREAGMDSRLSVKARTQEELDFMRAQVTQRLERTAEYKTYTQNPGRVYYTTLAGFSALKLETIPYGILFKMVPGNEKKRDYMPLMLLYTMRDYFNNRLLDLYYRDVLARYLVQYARYEAGMKNMDFFNFFRSWSENLAPDSGSVLNLISSIYYKELHDTPTAIRYMEKIMSLNPYDYGALDVLIKFCLEADRERAMNWFLYYYRIAPNKPMANDILVQIEKLREEKAQRDAGGK